MFLSSSSFPILPIQNPASERSERAIIMPITVQTIILSYFEFLTVINREMKR